MIYTVVNAKSNESYSLDPYININNEQDSVSDEDTTGYNQSEYFTSVKTEDSLYVNVKVWKYDPFYIDFTTEWNNNIYYVGKFTIINEYIGKEWIPDPNNKLNGIYIKTHKSK
jgi:hypothetical protein